MSELTKMVIKVDDDSDSFTLKINPETLKFNKEVKYKSIDTTGGGANPEKFDKYAPASLSFDFVLDATGIAYTKESISDTITSFEKVVFLYSGSEHRPNNLVVSWGTFIFKCHLKSLNYDYTLFAPSGEPLRVKISVSFSDSIELPEAETKANKSSPDMTHSIVLKAGESIPYWCNKIYGDSTYCTDVARHNCLTGFLNVEPGTEIVFPPLVRI